MLAIQAAEGVPLVEHEKWMSGGGGYKTVGKAEEERNIEEEAGIRRVMGWQRKAVANYCRLLGGKDIGKRWKNRIGRTDDAVCPRCREEESLDHIVVRCMGITRLKDIRGRREWVEKNDLRWDSWEELASKRWVRMEDADRVEAESSLEASAIVRPKDMYLEFFVFLLW